MTYTPQIASEQLDYGFLLLVHFICADKQIHSEEIKYLNELSDRANISQQTKDEMEKILAQDDHHLISNHSKYAVHQSPCLGVSASIICSKLKGK